MIHPLTFLKGAGLGAGMMYFFDPISGNRRRALVRDQLIHAGTKGSNVAEVVYRDAGNRFSGLIAECRSLFQHDAPSSEVLEARVKSKIGRSSSHPSAIQVRADNGAVTLQGPILANEVENLLANVRSVRGVRQINDQLEIHERPENISALQGGPRRGSTGQGNLSPTAMAAILLGGAGLAATMLRKRDVLALAFGTVGLSFVAKELADQEHIRAVGQQQFNNQRNRPSEQLQSSATSQSSGGHSQSQESNEGGNTEERVRTEEQAVQNL